MVLQSEASLPFVGAVMALSNRELVRIRVDVKDKPFFVRFKRFS